MGVVLLAGERGKRETPKAIQACNDYLRLGAARSLSILADSYAKTPENSPTRSYGTVRKWCTDYEWVKRAELYDAEIEALKTREANEIMNSGLSLPHKRVQILKELAAKLSDDIEKNTINRTDVKGVNGETVDIDILNEPVLRQLRGVLDDISKETGGRVTKTHNVDIDLSQFTPEMLRRVAAGDSPVNVLMDTYKKSE